MEDDHVPSIGCHFLKGMDICIKILSNYTPSFFYPCLHNVPQTFSLYQKIYLPPKRRMYFERHFLKPIINIEGKRALNL